MKTIKQIFEDQDILITKILQGRDKMVRIDAKTRFRRADEDNFFSKWVTEKYANKLSVERYGKKVSELNSYVL